MEKSSNRTNYRLFLFIASLTAFTVGTVMIVLPSYLKEVYGVTALQRGFIEFPRELPGVLAMFIIAAIAGYSNITISILAQVLAILGITVLGFTKPSYLVMLFFIFVNSLGNHIAIPINDTICMNISNPNQMGKDMGRYKGVQTGMRMVAGIFIYLGFQSGFLSFEDKYLWVFLIPAVVGTLALMFRLELFRRTKVHRLNDKKLKFVFRKKYINYYGLVVLHGLQKQTILVFGPWVVISIFDKGADTLALLSIIGSLIGMFFIPKLGVWLDRYGIRKLLFVDAWSYVIVYIAFGLLISAVTNGILPKEGFALAVVYLIYILDKMSNQMSMLRTLYLKKIAEDSTEVTPTLSLGLTLNHIVSITAAILSGYIWMLFGAEYIFYMIAAISTLNVFIASRVK